MLEAETCQQSKLLSSALTQYSALIRVVYSKGNLPVTECRQSSRANVPTYAGVTFPGRFIFVLALLCPGGLFVRKDALPLKFEYQCGFEMQSEISQFRLKRR